MFDLTATLALVKAESGATRTSRGTSALVAAKRASTGPTEFELRAAELRAAHEANPSKRAVKTNRPDEYAEQALTPDEQAEVDAFWDRLVWSSDLTASGRFARKIAYDENKAGRVDGRRRGGLELIGYSREDLLSDAVEVTLIWLDTDEDDPAKGEARRERATAENAEMRRVGMTEVAMPFSFGEMYRAINYAYKRGLNQFNYWRSGKVTELDGAGLIATVPESTVYETEKAQRKQLIEARLLRVKMAEIEAQRADGWVVETSTISPRLAELESLKEFYPEGESKMPLALAEALLHGVTITEFIGAVKDSTGKEYAASTITSWANKLGALQAAI